jgi:polyisoprenoid-binding protein YceI
MGMSSIYAGSVLAAAALGLAGIQSAAQAESYVFDPRKTEVRFFYVMGLSKQKGRFGQVSGTLQYDDGKLDQSSVTATVALSSLSTGEPFVDDELKGSDFFNVAAAPAMTFKSRTVRATGAETAEMKGDITLNGITRPITLEVSLRPHSDPALKYSAGARQFRATGSVKRSDFNMVAYQTMVGDIVDLEIDAIVRKKR